MCTWQSRKVLWDMINTLFLAQSMSNLLFLLPFSTHNYTPMASRAILSNFFEKQWTVKAPTIPFGLVACTFSDNLSRKSCILAFFVPFRLSRRWAWPRLLSLSFLMFWKPFARLRYLLRVTFYSVSRFQTGFHGGYHSPFHFHSVCRFGLFHSVRRFQLLWHVSPSRWFFSACVAFQLAISGVSRFH